MEYGKDAEEIPWRSTLADVYLVLGARFVTSSWHCFSSKPSSARLDFLGTSEFEVKE